MSDYSPGDGHTDEELAELDEAYGIEPEGPVLSDLEQQLIEEGWTIAGIVTLEAAIMPTGIDEEDVLLLARGLAANFTDIIASMVSEEGETGSTFLYREPSPEVTDQPDEKADDREDHENDDDGREARGEFHADYLPTFLQPLFSQDTPGVGGVPLAVNDAGVSTPPSAAS